MPSSSRAPQKQPVVLEGLTALVVDDDPAIAVVLGDLLGVLGVASRHAVSAEDARRILESVVPDLILLDIYLPGADGLSLLAELVPTGAEMRRARLGVSAARGKTPTVVIMSGAMTRSSLERALAYGAHGALAKGGITLERLEEVLSRAVSIREDAVQLASSPREARAPHRPMAPGLPTASLPTSSIPSPSSRTGGLSSSSRMESPRTHPDRLRNEPARTPERLATSHTEPLFAPRALELLDLLDQEDVAIGEIAAVLAEDPGVTMRVLALANSAAVAGGAVGTSLERAILALGIESLKDIALALALSTRRDPSGIISPGEWWIHAVATGFLASSLARSVGLSGNTALVAGLLHDAGIPHLATRDPAGYRRVLDAVERGPERLAVSESRLLGTDHTTAFEDIEGVSSLPGVVRTLVRQHHRPWTELVGLPGERASLALVLRVADALARGILTCAPSFEPWIELVPEAALTRLGLGEAELERILLERSRDLARIRTVAPLLGAEEPGALDHPRSSFVSEPIALLGARTPSAALFSRALEGHGLDVQSFEEPRGFEDERFSSGIVVARSFEEARTLVEAIASLRLAPCPALWAVIPETDIALARTKLEGAPVRVDSGLPLPWLGPPGKTPSRALASERARPMRGSSAVGRSLTP